MKKLFSVFAALFMAATCISAQSYVAEIECNGETTKYETASAFSSALSSFNADPISIKLLGDCDLGGFGSVTTMTQASLDLNGYTFTGCIFAASPITIDDSSEEKTGKMTGNNHVVYAYSATTINGGTFEGSTPIRAKNSAVVTLNGGKYEGGDKLFQIENQAKVIIAKGYEYTDGSKSITGTLTSESDDVNFDGSIVKLPVGEIEYDGKKTQYKDVTSFVEAVESIKSGEKTITLLSDCDLESEGSEYLSLYANTTFDLNGNTLTGYLNIIGPTSIYDNSDDKTGKVIRSNGSGSALDINANTTIYGGTFEGKEVIIAKFSTVVTLKGGTYIGDDSTFSCDLGATIVVAKGYVFSYGEETITGTITEDYLTLPFNGSIVKLPVGEIVKDGVTTTYTDEEEFKVAMYNIYNGEIEVRLLSNCDLGFEGTAGLEFRTTATFDLNGYTLTGYVYARAKTTINDSSEEKTGKVVANDNHVAINAAADVTVNGGTFEGDYSVFATDDNTVTLNGGTFCADETYGAFYLLGGAKVVIADGYEYFDGISQSIKGTLTAESDKVKFAGTVKQTPMARIIVENDATIDCYDAAEFKSAISGISSTKTCSVTLFADCDFGDNGGYSLVIYPKTTIDLNGYTITGNLSFIGEATINDSSEEKTGKVVAAQGPALAFMQYNSTINGGTFEGSLGSLYVSSGCNVTLNGGTYSKGTNGVFVFQGTSKVIIPDGFEYTNGEKSVTGTLTAESEKVDFAGSVVKLPIAQIVKDGVTTKYAYAEEFKSALEEITSGEIAVTLLADCDLGDDGSNYIEFKTAATFDLNGYTITGYVAIKAAVTINDSSEGKTGKVEPEIHCPALIALANCTINGGTFHGYYAIYVVGGETTLYGGTYEKSSSSVFNIDGGKVTIADGYEYTDGENQPLTGTLTKDSEPVKCNGSVVAQTSTGIGTLGVKQSEKTIKTIENGRVVIIKGDEKFDMMGRKL